MAAALEALWLKVFIKVPNIVLSGGIKVAFQLARLFLDKGHEAFVCTPDGARRRANYFLRARSVPIIPLRKVPEMSGPSDLSIDNWPSSQMRSISNRTKGFRVFYSQGCSNYNSSFRKGFDVSYLDRPNGWGIDMGWAVSQPSLAWLRKAHPTQGWYYVPPYFEHACMAELCKDAPAPSSSSVLTYDHKGRPYWHRIYDTYRQRQFPAGTVTFGRIKRPMSEMDVYRMCCRYGIFLATADDPRCGSNQYDGPGGVNGSGHNRMEGFPLPPAEAALLGCCVAGWAMGGGREWMDSTSCFLAADPDYRAGHRFDQVAYAGLCKVLEDALNADGSVRAAKVAAARKKLSRFTAEHTWHHVEVALKSAGVL